MTKYKQQLLNEIDAAFTYVEMPRADELVLHDKNCSGCSYLGRDLDEYRDKDITSDAIRLVHQELSHFSAKGMRWLLPHYLRFCLTPEAEFDRMEMEFLIFHFSPSVRFQSNVLEQLRYLDDAQMATLIHFFEWFSWQPYWKENYSEDIAKVINFLHTKS